MQLTGVHAPDCTRLHPNQARQQTLGFLPFLASGKPGYTGYTGAAGAPGADGRDGASGSRGPIGAVGLAGADGEAGAVLTVSDAGTGTVGVVDISSFGTRIEITGAGFDAGESVSLSIDGADIGAASADAGGAIFFRMLLPSSLSKGDVVSVRADGSNGTVGWGVVLVTDKNALN